MLEVPKRPSNRPRRCSDAEADRPTRRWRPGCGRATLDEFVGQPHLVGDDGALSRVVQPGYLPSMSCLGPARVRQDHPGAAAGPTPGGTWRQLSGVTSGVADLRALVADARALRSGGGR